MGWGVHGLTPLVGDQQKDVDDELQAALGGEVEVGIGYPTVTYFVAANIGVRNDDITYLFSERFFELTALGFFEHMKHRDFFVCSVQGYLVVRVAW